MLVSRQFTAIVVLALGFVFAVACGGNSQPTAPESDEPSPAGSSGLSVDGPASSGMVAADTFLTFDDQRYELRETLQADLVADEFTEVGVASDADIDHVGELAVYRRAGEDSAVYTLSPALDEEGDEADVPALWLRWEPVE